MRAIGRRSTVASEGDSNALKLVAEFAQRYWARSLDTCSLEAIRVQVQLLPEPIGHLESNSRPA